MLEKIDDVKIDHKKCVVSLLLMVIRLLFAENTESYQYKSQMQFCEH